MKLILLTLVLFGSLLNAQIKTETVEYKDGNTVLEGYIAYNNQIKSKMPVVIIIHDWMGQGEFSKNQAEDIAKLGYIGFAVDVYGKGVRPKNAGEAGQLAGKYKGDRMLFRSRLKAAMDFIIKNKLTDKDKIGAIGFCFGGTGALELARSGADVKGVVSFHGGLDTPSPDDAKNIKGKVLILHGADDPYVSDKEINSFKDEMNNAKVDWQMNYYSGAVHAYTNPKAGNDNSKGAAYNEKASKRSFEEMKRFFREIFGN